MSKVFFWVSQSRSERHKKLKPTEKPKKKPLTLYQITQEIHEFLEAKGYMSDEFQKKKHRVGHKTKKIKGKTKKQSIYQTVYESLLYGGEYRILVFKNKSSTYTIEFLPKNKSVKPTNEKFISVSMHFENYDKRVLTQMLKRMEVNPSK